MAAEADADTREAVAAGDATSEQGSLFNLFLPAQLTKLLRHFVYVQSATTCRQSALGNRRRPGISQVYDALGVGWHRDFPAVVCKASPHLLCYSDGLL